jgi:plasmid replication initiation protein
MEIIKQSNYITNARYNFSENEMKVLIYIIKTVQEKLNSNSPEIQKDLFGDHDYKVFAHLDHIDEANSKRIRKALKDLRQRSFEVETDTTWLECGFISSAVYDKTTNKYEIRVSPYLMPYMISVAKGYTTFQLETTLNLNSHAKRLYMLLSEFANTGVFRIQAEKLRDNLGCTEGYSLYKSFKNAVINRSLNEINTLAEQGKCDLFAEVVNDKKDKLKDEWDRTIEFRIVSNKKKSSVPIPHEQKVELYQEVAGMLTAIYKNDFKFCEKITAHFANRADLAKFHKELCRNVEKSENAIPYKPLTSLGALIRSIARKHFEFEKDFKPKAEKNEVNLANELSNKWNVK